MNLGPFFEGQVSKGRRFAKGYLSQPQEPCARPAGAHNQETNKATLGSILELPTLRTLVDPWQGRLDRQLDLVTIPPRWIFSTMKTSDIDGVNVRSLLGAVNLVVK